MNYSMLLSRQSNISALLLGVTTLVLYFHFSYHLDRTDFVKLISLYTSLFFIFLNLLCQREEYLLIIGVLSRLIFLFSLPNLSQDFYRFIWDGRLISQGINPYLFTPNYLMSLGDFSIPQAKELFQEMGSLSAKNYSNYPPVNQLFFFITTIFSSKSILGSVLILRIIIILADLGLFYLGRKLLSYFSLPKRSIYLYFLNPLILIELTGNLHFEGIMLLFMIWSIYFLILKKYTFSAIAITISIGIKLLPLLLLPLFIPFFLQNKDGKFSIEWKYSKRLLTYICVCILTALPFFIIFSDINFVTNYKQTIALWFTHFEFNGSIYNIVKWIGKLHLGYNPIRIIGKFSPLIICITLLVITFYKKPKNIAQWINTALLLLTSYFFLSTTVHPWYIATLVGIGIFSNYTYPFIWSALITLSYYTYSQTRFQRINTYSCS